MHPSIDDELRFALGRLRDGDIEVREAALGRVREIAQSGLSTNQVALVLDAASGDFPPAKYAFESYDDALIRVTWHHISDEHLPLLSSMYGRLTPATRAAALAAMAHLGTHAATTSWVYLLTTHGWPDKAYPAVTVPYETSPRFAETLLPALLKDRVRGLPAAIKWGLLLAYTTQEMVPRAMVPHLRAAALEDAKNALDKAVPFQQLVGRAWRWDDAYAEARGETGLLLDALGRLGADTLSVELLRFAEGLADPRLRLLAVVSLARLDHEPAALALDAIASDPETRNHLFDAVASLNKRDLFPQHQSSQAKLAESDMVQWLTFPTELGRAPDHIELMTTIERDLGPDAGVVVYFVFRFKTDPPHWSAEDGWMAGVAGPFSKSDFPTTQAWGDTFSTFTRWGEFSAEEHLASVEELMQRWREAHDMP